MKVQFTPYWSAEVREAKRIHEDAMASMGALITSAEFEIISPEPRDHEISTSPAPHSRHLRLDFSAPPSEMATGTIPAHNGLRDPFQQPLL